MANTWGAQTWGIGNWNDLTNSTVISTGIGLSGGLSSVSTTSTVELGWGRDVWGARAWGTPNQIVNPVTPEDELTMALASVSVTAELNTGWGRLTWGDNAWGEYGDVVISGIGMTANLGSVITTADANATNSTNLLSAATSSSTAVGTTVAYLDNTNLLITSALGTADAGPDAMLTGNQATVSVGSVEAYNLEGWGRYFWGQYEWGATGEWDTASVTGQALTASLGNESITGNANVNLTGYSISTALGTADAEPDAMATGQAFTVYVGSVTIEAHGNVSVTGEVMSVALGTATLDANSLIDVTGFALTTTLGNEDTDANARVYPTGNGVTMSLGTGTTLIWTEVDTGSAPLDPPGWWDVAA